MKNIVINYQILTTASQMLHKVCQPVQFPLTQQTISNITYLKACFKRSLNNTITIGLAAPQVGIDQRFFIVPSSFGYLKHKTKTPALMKGMIRGFNVFINPNIIERSPQKEFLEQTCLSVDYSNKFYRVNRNKKINVQYQNMDGKVIKEQLNGIMAIVFQHQLDHLNGVTIQDVGVFTSEKEQEIRVQNNTNQPQNKQNKQDKQNKVPL